MGSNSKSTAELRQLGIEAIDNGRSLLIRTAALRQWLEAKEEHALIRAGAVEAIATDDVGGSDIGLALENFGDLKACLFGLAQGRAVLELEDAQAIPLIFFRNESRGQG